MPIHDAKYKALVPDNVRKAPRKKGVYALYEARTLIYLGKASFGTATIRAMLESHLSGETGTATGRATHYKREATDDPDGRQKVLLAEHVARHGCPPRGNAAPSAP